jgi:HD-like signal output (HDOD) protein
MLPRTQIEESVLGFSHTDLGAVLARKWNLPRQIKNAIFFHHNTTECDTEEDHQTVAAVHVADRLCAISGVGGTDKAPAGKTLKEIVIPDAITQLYLDDEKMEKYLWGMKDVKAEAELFMESLKDKK